MKYAASCVTRNCPRSLSSELYYTDANNFEFSLNNLHEIYISLEIYFTRMINDIIKLILAEISGPPCRVLKEKRKVTRSASNNRLAERLEDETFQYLQCLD